MFSPSPTFAGETANRAGSAGAESVSYVSAKQSKVSVKRNLLCIKAQLEHYKYVLASDVYDDKEQKAVHKNVYEYIISNV